jgi:hypothetical protein
MKKPLTTTFRPLWGLLLYFTVLDAVVGPFLVHWDWWTRDQLIHSIQGDVSIASFLFVVWVFKWIERIERIEQ